MSNPTIESYSADVPACPDWCICGELPRRDHGVDGEPIRFMDRPNDGTTTSGRVCGWVTEVLHQDGSVVWERPTLMVTVDASISPREARLLAADLLQKADWIDPPAATTEAGEAL